MKSTGTVRVIVALTLTLLGVAGFASALDILIDFTGGTGTTTFGSGIFDTTFPPDLTSHGNVLTYTENGFTFTSVGGDRVWVGDFYDIDRFEDVLHMHFSDDGGGNDTDSTNTTTGLKLNRAGGGTFSLKSFEVTSNVFTQEGPVSDGDLTTGGDGPHEAVTVSAFDAGGFVFSFTIGPEEFGLADTNALIDLVALGYFDAFSEITEVTFTTASGANVFGFGVDNFVMVIPEPATLLLFGAGLLGLACRGIRRRRSAF